MNPITNLIAGIKSLLQKPRVDRELEEELDSFIQASAAHKQKSGLDPATAQRLAKIEVGSRNSVKHQVWSSRWESTIDGLLTDLRLAFRSLIKTPDSPSSPCFRLPSASEPTQLSSPSSTRSSSATFPCSTRSSSSPLVRQKAEASWAALI